jgi:hypothetical protein
MILFIQAKFGETGSSCIRRGRSSGPGRYGTPDDRHNRGGHAGHDRHALRSQAGQIRGREHRWDAKSGASSGEEDGRVIGTSRQRPEIGSGGMGDGAAVPTILEGDSVSRMSLPGP